MGIPQRQVVCLLLLLCFATAPMAGLASAQQPDIVQEHWYHSYLTLTADVQSWEDDYPDIVNVVSAGTTLHGRQQWVVQISDWSMDSKADGTAKEMVYIDGGHHGPEDARHQRLVPQQGGAGRHPAHLLRRATHVDVDDLGPLVHVGPGRLGHHRRVGADDLHRNRPLLATEIEPAHRLAQRLSRLPARRVPPSAPRGGCRSPVPAEGVLSPGLPAASHVAKTGYAEARRPFRFVRRAEMDVGVRESGGEETTGFSGRSRPVGARIEPHREPLRRSDRKTGNGPTAVFPEQGESEFGPPPPHGGCILTR